MIEKLRLALHCFFKIFYDADWAARIKTLTAGNIVKKKASQPSSVEALRLLAFLQEEGRLVDFLMEDISLYEDEQVGAAVREIHTKTSKALRKIMDIVPVVKEQEGEPIEVKAGFNPENIKLVGQVKGQPPFHGVVKHHGWKITRSELPAGNFGADILAPAEVEMG